MSSYIKIRANGWSKIGHGYFIIAVFTCLSFLVDNFLCKIGLGEWIFVFSISTFNKNWVSIFLFIVFFAKKKWIFGVKYEISTQQANWGDSKESIDCQAHFVSQTMSTLKCYNLLGKQTIRILFFFEKKSLLVCGIDKRAKMYCIESLRLISSSIFYGPVQNIQYFDFYKSSYGTPIMGK